jgi:uncharacterized membrane protein YkoI
MKAIYAWIIGGAAAAILITLCLLRWPWPQPLSAAPLEEQAVIQSVLHQYPGDMLESKRSGRYYLMKLRHPKGKYDIKVNAYDGIIESIKRTQAYTDAGQSASPTDSTGKQGQDSAPDHKGSNGNSLNPPPSKDKPGIVSPPDPVSLVITEKEAAKLAAKAVNGISDDIELHRNENSLYYLVEVEVKDGREAVVQVNAVSGSIDSITWEKEKQSNDD